MKASPPVLFDIGANLGHESFANDFEAVLDRAYRSGVHTIVVTGTTLEASRKAQDIAHRYPDRLFATAGIHPHDASEFSPQNLGELESLSRCPEIIALGETGLDYHRNYSSREDQLRAFEAQLQLAAGTDMPLFLHQRDAHGDFHALLRRYRPELGNVVVHCFTGTRQELEDYLALDTYIGITGWICDERRGHHLHDLVKLIPADRLMLETDAPYLLPRNIHPKPASRRNEPANLPWVLSTVARCLETTETELAAQTVANARRFFRLEDSTY